MAAVIKSVRPLGLLSFGRDTAPLKMRPLNILIGPNGSGKSNFVQLFSLLRAAATSNFDQYLVGEGDADNLLWKGIQGTDAKASIEVVMEYPDGSIEEGNQDLRYELGLVRSPDGRVIVRSENLEGMLPRQGTSDVAHYVFPASIDSKSSVRAFGGQTVGVRAPAIAAEILSFELRFVSTQLRNMRFYLDWNLGKGSPVRMPHVPKSNNESLSEDIENLGTTLQNFLLDNQFASNLKRYLGKIYDDAEDIRSRFGAGGTELMVKEELGYIPISRLSTGTLRWLGFLTALLQPPSFSPSPSAIFLEEPEIGLHPDMIPILAALLREASEHSQIVVTTHSDYLVEQFSDEPEAVVVCERNRLGTRMTRLDKDTLKLWLENYTLGQLWNSGFIGGTK